MLLFEVRDLAAFVLSNTEKFKIGGADARVWYDDDVAEYRRFCAIVPRSIPEAFS